MPVPQMQGLNSSGSPAGFNSQNRRTGPQRVFVYGTLKRGYGNHTAYLQEAKYLGPAAVQGIMFHLGGFPAINLSEEFSEIAGEVYEVCWDELLDMDALEGVGRNFYDRVEVRVKPHGAVWTYIFPRDRAAKEKLVIPSGVWEGPNTLSVEWAGFGKGLKIGKFMTDDAAQEVRIGPGDSPFYLVRTAADGLYRIVNKTTGDVLGPYRYLRDMVGRDGRQKPVLGLPKQSVATTVCVRCGKAGCEHLSAMAGVPQMTKLVDAAIRESLLEDGRLVPYNPPARQQVIANLPALIPNSAVESAKEEEKEIIPQSARLLGLKYGAA